VYCNPERDHCQHVQAKMVALKIQSRMCRLIASSSAQSSCWSDNVLHNMDMTECRKMIGCKQSMSAVFSAY
jgi:hypothetical protein